MKEFIEKLFSSQHKCLFLLIVFLLWLLAGTSLVDTVYGSAYITVCMIFLAMGPYVIIRNRKLLVASLTLAIAVVIMKVVFHNSENIPWLLPYLCVVLLFFDFAMTASIVYYTTISGRYTRDSIFGCIFTYLMIGICFADTYYMLQYFDLVRFSVAGAAQNRLHLEDCIYFSFTSLTTMGYGDILPYSPLTKRLSYIEAAVGTMYTAIFIGRLISTYESHRVNSQ